MEAAKKPVQITAFWNLDPRPSRAIHKNVLRQL